MRLSHDEHEKRREARSYINQLHTHNRGYIYPGMSCETCTTVNCQAPSRRIKIGTYRLRRMPYRQNSPMFNRPPAGVLAELLNCSGFKPGN